MIYKEQVAAEICPTFEMRERKSDTHNLPRMSLTFIESSWMSKSIRRTWYSKSYLSLSNFAMVAWYSLHSLRSSSSSAPIEIAGQLSSGHELD